MHRRFITRGLAVLLFLGMLAPAARAQITTDALLDSLQYGAFRFFWDEANPANGLIRDRSQPGSPCSVAATGFGLSAICIGVDHGWVSRAAAADRVRTALQTFWAKPQGTAVDGMIGYKGLFYHFLKMNDASREWSSEVSTIDTALLLAGIIDARQYFDGPDTTEVGIRAIADSLYRRMDWVFMKAGGSGIRHGWRPADPPPMPSGFIPYTWVGYNEAMILYILALGSPTFPVPNSDWNTWTSGYVWRTNYFGQTFLQFPPLFGHQYSHSWVDFRLANDAYMTTKGITYFENSRRATLAQRTYCIANPGHWVGYSDTLWGLTASDDPDGYLAHGAPPAQDDNGTITPTAVASSIAFAPEVVIPTLKSLYNNYKPYIWGPYGFTDAFNLSRGWFDQDELGIDQGPIILMIENYRTQRVWRRFMTHPNVRLGLQRAGFIAVTDVPAGEVPDRPAAFELLPATPNPFGDRTLLRYRLSSPSRVRLTLHDVVGREVARIVDGDRLAGAHEESLEGRVLPSGVYRLRLDVNGGVAKERLIVRIR